MSREHLKTLLVGLAIVVCAAVTGTAQTAAGLKWMAPSGWKSEGARPFRAATYTVPPVGGDREAAECGVYFFGQGQGGSVDANLERWKSQFVDASGKPAAATVARTTAHGLKVTKIDASGVYTGAGGPAGGGAPLPGYRLLGAIVESAGGNIFVKFTGPAKTMAANQAKFEQLIASFERGM